MVEKQVKNLDIGFELPKSIEDIDKIGIDMSKVEEGFIIAMLIGYSNLGRSHEFAEEENPFEMVFDEAIKYFVEIKRMSYEVIEGIKDEVHENFGYILENTRLELQVKLLNNIINNLERGLTIEEWLEGISDIIGTMGLGRRGSYYEMVYRTNLQTAYSIGHYKAQVEYREEFPYWLYDGVVDGREQKHTRTYDGKVYRADDAMWDVIYPPNNYNCRCDVIALGVDDIGEYKVERRNKKRVEEAKKTLGKFGQNPAKDYYKNIAKEVDKKRGKVEELKKEVK